MLLLLLLLLSLSASLSLPHTHTLSHYSLCINDNHDQNRKKEHGLPVPAYDSLRVSPGQAFICHHQTLHKASANRSGDTRTTLYFRLTRAGRPKGCSETFLDAMLASECCLRVRKGGSSCFRGWLLTMATCAAF